MRNPDLCKLTTQEEIAGHLARLRIAASTLCAEIGPLFALSEEYPTVNKFLRHVQLQADVLELQLGRAAEMILGDPTRPPYRGRPRAAK